jgi:hypothetical protein
MEKSGKRPRRLTENFCAETAGLASSLSEGETRTNPRTTYDGNEKS